MSNQNQAIIYNYLAQKGYQPHQIAGVLAAAKNESNFNTGALNPNDGPNGSSYGLFQWNGDRQTALKQFTGSNAPNVTQQIDFFLHELNTNEKAAGDALRAARNPAEAAQAMANFERFRGYNDPNNHEYQQRIKDAHAFAGTEYTPMSTEQIAAAGGQPGAPMVDQNGQTAPQKPQGIMASLISGKDDGKGGTKGGLLNALQQMGETPQAPQMANFGSNPVKGNELSDYINSYSQSAFRKNPFQKTPTFLA